MASFWPEPDRKSLAIWHDESFRARLWVSSANEKAENKPVEQMYVPWRAGRDLGKYVCQLRTSSEPTSVIPSGETKSAP